MSNTSLWSVASGSAQMSVNQWMPGAVRRMNWLSWPSLYLSLFPFEADYPTSLLFARFRDQALAHLSVRSCLNHLLSCPTCSLSKTPEACAFRHTERHGCAKSWVSRDRPSSQARGLSHFPWIAQHGSRLAYHYPVTSGHACQGPTKARSGRISQTTTDNALRLRKKNAFPVQT